MNRNNDREQRGGETLHCADARDMIPLAPAGALARDEGEALARHLQGCSECAEESRFATRIAASRPRPPADLHGRVMARLAAGAAQGPLSGVRSGLAWSLPAAAVLVLAMGIGLIWSAGHDDAGDLVTASLLEVPQESDAQVEEWIVAGAPVLDALPYEVLVSLMTEVDG